MHRDDSLEFEFKPLLKHVCGKYMAEHSTKAVGHVVKRVLQAIDATGGTTPPDVSAAGMHRNDDASRDFATMLTQVCGHYMAQHPTKDVSDVAVRVLQVLSELRDSEPHVGHDTARASVAHCPFRDCDAEFSTARSNTFCVLMHMQRHEAHAAACSPESLSSVGVALCRAYDTDTGHRPDGCQVFVLFGGWCPPCAYKASVSLCPFPKCRGSLWTAGTGSSVLIHMQRHISDARSITAEELWSVHVALCAGYDSATGRCPADCRVFVLLGGRCPPCEQQYAACVAVDKNRGSGRSDTDHQSQRLQPQPPGP